MFDKLFGDKSSVDRIVGGTKKEQKSLRKEMDRRFDDQERFDDIEKFEREKTPFEQEAIRLANEATDALREKYGLPSYEVPVDNAHILERNSETERRFHTSYVMPHQAFVMVEKPSKAETLKSIFHEMTHFKSYTSIEPRAGGIHERRLGLTASVEGEKTPAFVPLNEAVTEELTMRFMRQQENHPELSQGMRNLRKAREEFPAKDMRDIYSVRIKKEHPDGSVDLTFEGFGYRKERTALDLLIAKLKERNPKTFRDKEEWFDMFAGAMFNGHLLEIARAVEGAFGKGKFRELGEQKTGEEMLKFVESL